MCKKILIENLICNASVGVYENEKLHKQRIIINLEILLTKKMKTDTDNLSDVADYGKFRRIILDVVNSKHFNLIETLADKLLEKIKTFEKVENIKLKITKPDIFDDCSVSYEISNYP
tara:strand:+ start:755 stop:1105 length:351 start_codon:yes stop_codon:yes gene_type:complete